MRAAQRANLFGQLDAVGELQIGAVGAPDELVQPLVLGRGHDIGAPDGLIGARTREAIKAEQQRLGMKPDGRAGQKLLGALRG